MGHQPAGMRPMSAMIARLCTSSAASSSTDTSDSDPWTPHPTLPRLELPTSTAAKPPRLEDIADQLSCCNEHDRSRENAVAILRLEIRVGGAETPAGVPSLADCIPRGLTARRAQIGRYGLAQILGGRARQAGRGAPELGGRGRRG